MDDSLKQAIILVLIIGLFILVASFGWVDDRRDKRWQQQFDRIEAKCK